jgi:hypothetical protein
MEQTRTNAGAFIDESKLIVDGGFRTAANNVAFEFFGDGSGTRGYIGSATAVGATYTIVLSNSQQVVNFEVGQNLVNYAYVAGVISAISATTGYVQAVDRSAGILTIVASAVDASWTTVGNALGVYGDIQLGAVNTGTSLCMSGLAAWIPSVTPGAGDSFWGVNRSFDPTRLAGLRSNGSADPIDVAITNALAFLNREGGKPDLAVMDFFSYAALVNALGAKVQYVQVNHDEVEIAFEGLTFQSAYGRVTVLADRSCPPQTCYLLTMSTWKIRSLGKVPHILTYGKLHAA